MRPRRVVAGRHRTLQRPSVARRRCAQSNATRVVRSRARVHPRVSHRAMPSRRTPPPPRQHAWPGSASRDREPGRNSRPPLVYAARVRHARPVRWQILRPTPPLGAAKVAVVEWRAPSRPRAWVQQAASPHGARREAALQAVHLEQQTRMLGGFEQRGIHRAARSHESDGPRRTAAINELLGDSERGDDMPGGSAAGDDGKDAR